MDHSDIIELWETTAEMAAAFGVPYQTAAAWRRRGRIPSKHWSKAIQLAEPKGAKLSLENFNAAA
jgi:sugar phosphate isomerase/epimerase